MTRKDTLESIQEMKANRSTQLTETNSSPCPSCGYCPACGRGGHWAQPWFPQPYPWQPWITSTTSGGTSADPQDPVFITGMTLTKTNTEKP